jgi:hypothetical protein
MLGQEPDLLLVGAQQLARQKIVGAEVAVLDKTLGKEFTPDGLCRLR